MPANIRFKRPMRYAPAEKISTPQPWGGAVPTVQRRYVRAVNASMRKEFPLLASYIYQPPAIVNTPVEINQIGFGMVDRIYQPASEKPRQFGDKFAEWFKNGRFE